jgi:hypothetical protein
MVEKISRRFKAVSRRNRLADYIEVASHHMQGVKI